ncbi:MAG: PhoH family protein, partial [Planctomycetota bacterium]
RTIFESLLDRAGRTGEVGDDDVERLLGPAPAAVPAGEAAPARAERRTARASTVPIGDPAFRTIDLRERGRTVTARTKGQDGYLRAIDENDLVFCMGPAGSGKTYLAVAAAIAAVREAEVRKIVLARPAVEAGERLGFLPGDMLAKVNPYFRPLLDALGEMIDPEQLKAYRENDMIEVVPLAFMRGRTLNETFIILDEAQNTTVTQMKMFLTRMGEGSKVVVTGDATQNDLPEGTLSGLNDAARRLGNIDGVSVVKLDRADIVRHRLVREIVKAYDGPEGRPGPPRAAGSKRSPPRSGQSRGRR